MQNNDYSELPTAPIEDADSLDAEPERLYSDREAEAVHAAVLASKERRRLRLKKAQPKRKGTAKEPFTLPQILAWVDSHHSRTGAWPTITSGPVFESPTDTWSIINDSLQHGHRGCPGGSSLRKLLISEHRIQRAGNTRRENWTETGILELADRFYAEQGRWPNPNDGPLEEGSKATWVAVDIALRKGNRGLPGGSSLIRLLSNNRGVPNCADLPDFTYDTILKWADSHHARTGSWPKSNSGPILECPGETWAVMDQRMRKGQRGFDRKLPLAHFLHAERGARIYHKVQPLNIQDIRQWIQHHYETTGNWPTNDSGDVLAAPGEVWSSVEAALNQGGRGLPYVSSLAKLTAEMGGKRKTVTQKHNLTMPVVVQKIAEYHAQHNVWPTATTKNPVPGTQDTWCAIDLALRRGNRGLPGGTSLSTLIADEFAVVSHIKQPTLTFDMILNWCDSHKATTGDWPTAKSGTVLDSPHENWARIARSMDRGQRGLPQAISLSRLLERERGVPHKFRQDLTVELILAWADDYNATFGRLPNMHSEESIPQSPGDKWRHIDHALRDGTRSLPGGSSLSQLLVEYRGKRTHQNAPPLSPEQIEIWARLHFDRTGTWPSYAAGGRVLDAPEEAWRSINEALARGKRGLKGCGYRSLAELLDKRIRKANR